MNFFMQLTFRLIDFLTCSIMPFLMPDIFPDNIDDVKKRISDAYKTNYII